MADSIRIPGVELDGELGRGTYSVVYRGRLGGRPCAVKVPRVRGRWTRWVYREAVALARVRHPALASVLEVGECDGLPYIVMDLVQGRTLDAQLMLGRLSVEQTLSVGAQLASALEAVHGIGLLHRDVKPRNIVLGDDGIARLIDFGFATPIDLAGDEGERAGTREYSAPEQLQPTGRPDGRSDLYALGQVLRRCLLGLDGGDGGREGAPLEGPVEAIVSGLVPTDPALRYPDARALSRDLDRVRRGGAPLGPSAYRVEPKMPVLVGRARALEAVTGPWLSAGAAGGSVTLVRGRRGSGKSTLLRAASAAARTAGRRVIEVASCQDDWPLATLQRISAAYIASLSQAAPQGKTVRDVLRAIVDERLRPFARLMALPRVEGEGPEERAAEAAPGGFAAGAAELLMRMAAALGPAVLVIDDLHWIDPISREVIARLASRLHDGTLSLTLAARWTDTPPAALGQILDLPPGVLTLVELEPLARPDVAQIVARHLNIGEVAPSLLARVEALGDGTPLGVMEVLETFLDCGAVRPRSGGWEVDEARAESVVLPPGALVFLGHRLIDLPQAARRVLEAAAVIGAAFPTALLQSVLGVASGDLSYALDDALRAGFLTRQGDEHRFVHASLRELLLEGLDAEARRRIHQRVAETLDGEPLTTFELRCATALHYAAGELEKTPAAAYHAARTAAAAALERFDNETTLRFLDLARGAAAAGRLAIDVSFFRCAGEAELRVGMLESSLRSFEVALDLAGDADARAVLLGRIAWVHQVRGDAELAWKALERAFSTVGVVMPGDDPAATARAMGALAHAGLRRRFVHPPTLGVRERARAELVCDLHYQNARLGGEYGKPLRLAQSTLEALRCSRPLGEGRARARARAMYGFLLSAARLTSAAEREFAAAERMARATGDATTQAFRVQIQGVAACFSGSLDLALKLLHECVEVYGPWLELNEYCLDAATADHIESVRGRPAKALGWTTRAVQRLRQSPQLTAGCTELIVQRARAALAACGRSTEETSLLGELGDARPAADGPRRPSLYEEVAWGPLVRVLVERGADRAELDALARRFDAKGYSPRAQHPMVAEYHIALCHARLQLCLELERETRTTEVEELRRAYDDLQRVAKLALYRAHAVFIRASLAWLDARPADAERLLLEAAFLAESETCPWVLSEVARLRARMLRARGLDDSALDQARIAEALAREHGALPRAQRIREEFGLPSAIAAPRAASSRGGAQSSAHARRQLETLLRAIQKSFAGMSPEQQARAILTDLLSDLRADRGVLSLSANVGLGMSEALLVTHDQHVGEPDGGAWPSERLRRVVETGVPWPSEDDADTGDGRVAIFPLWLDRRTIGAVALERRTSARPFSEMDRELLLLLCHQLPVAIEITALLAARDKVQTAALRGQRLEALGRLAGGVAHDFNNMLMVIRASTDAIRAQQRSIPYFVDEVREIEGAARRAAVLSRQLLSFSRHKPTPPAHWHVRDLVVETRSILERLLGTEIRLTVEAPTDLPRIKVERGGFEQALVNLAINARDAMPNGGALLVEASYADRAATSAGERADQVVLKVSDTGTGMTSDVLARVFEPFFTTKPDGKGTGLGLAAVYAFVKNHDGHIEVDSEPGKGTSFTIFLPAAGDGAAVVSEPSRHEGPRPSRASRTILLVDDDPFARRMIERNLARHHYTVLASGNAADALRVAGDYAADIGLMVLDVQLPGMTGPELGRHLATRCPQARQLFISGFAPQHVATTPNVDFILKPFSSEELIARVERLLES